MRADGEGDPALRGSAKIREAQSRAYAQHGVALVPARDAMPADFSARHLAMWMSLRQTAGADPARILAATGIVVLGQRRGDSARQRFFAAKFGPARPEDARGWLGDVLHPARLRAAAGIDEESLVAEWRDELAVASALSPP